MGISTRLVLHTFNSSQDSRKISNFINFSINTFKIFLILGSFSLIRVFIFICFYSKDTFLFSILVDGISLNNFVLFGYSAVMTIIYSINLILWVFNFGSNTILPIILTFNRKFLPIILLAFILPKILSFNFNHLSFNIFNI